MQPTGLSIMIHMGRGDCNNAHLSLIQECNYQFKEIHIKFSYLLRYFNNTQQVSIISLYKKVQTFFENYYLEICLNAYSAQLINVFEEIMKIRWISANFIKKK